MALPVIVRCVCEVHFIYPVFLFEQPRPSLSLRWSFTRVDHERWCSSELPFLSFFNSVIQIIMEIAPSSCDSSDIDICLDKNRPVFGCVVAVVLLSEYTRRLQFLLNGMNDSVSMFEMGLHLRSVRCCCSTGLVQNQILFLQQSNWMGWTDLVTWIVISHLLITHQMKCVRTCRTRRDIRLLTKC